MKRPNEIRDLKRFLVGAAIVLVIFVWGVKACAQGSGGVFSPGLSSSSISNADNPTFLTLMKGLEAGNTFSNVNRYGWGNWYAKLRASTTSTQQIFIAAETDGLGSIGIMTKTALSPTNFGFPVVGYMNGVFPQWVGIVGGNAVQNSEHDGLWYPTWFNLPGQNDSVTFKDFFAVGPLANAVTVYYVKEPGAGHIKVETNINGGAFGVANASLDASAGSFDAGIFSVTNTLGLGNLQVRVTQIDSAKSVKIIYPKVWNTYSNGIIFGTFQGGGSDKPGDILCTNLTWTGKVWADLNPTLILDCRVTTTDDGSATVGATYTNLVGWYRFWKTNFTATDLIVAGEYPNGDTLGVNTLGEYIMRTNAQYYGFGYFDGWSPFISKDNFFNRGWVNSLGDVHANATGVGVYEDMFMHWLNLPGYGGATAGLSGFAVAPTAITFPATTVNWTNNLGRSIVLYIDNAAVTATTLKKNGQQIAAGISSNCIPLALKIGDYFSQTYSAGSPTARWEPQ